ncbi:hypothetical protein RAS1_24360 [Phycisphaerae bacterium RAS1]|nr:hypothetical protein RAS1_24360 [Phycisphaerae bacterium RAS1]
MFDRCLPQGAGRRARGAGRKVRGGRRALRPAPCALLLLASLSACQAPQPAAPPPSDSPADRRRAALGDLDTGRFIRVADFESPAQLHDISLFPPPQDSAPAAPPIEITRTEFGGQAMRVPLTAHERLAVELEPATDSARPNDWRPYTLLLMNIRAAAAAACEITIECDGDPQRWSQTVQLYPMWCLLRFDLVELAECIDLTRIRRITWRLLTDDPTELWLDDLILSDNRKYLFGESTAAGELYVRRAGRYLEVGARGRLELAFDDGVIARATLGDGVNVAGPFGLGPWPIAMDLADGRPPARFFADPAAAVERAGRVLFASERIEEASPLRVVVTGEWRFIDSDFQQDTPPANLEVPPAQRWRYTIHRSGQVFIEVVSDAGDEGWPGRDFGYSLTFRGATRRDTPRSADSGPRLVAADPCQIDFGPGSASNVCWATFPRMTSLTTADSDDGAAVGFVAAGQPATERFRAVHGLRWSPTLTPRPLAEQFATLLADEPRCHMRAGRLRTDAPGDADADGFNEAEGCYELALDGNLLRCTFDQPERLLIDPMFRIDGAAGRQCWIYANGRAVQATARDATGRLLFTLPGIVRPPLLIEANVK